MRTRFTDLVGCRLPFQLAVLGGVGTLELATAVDQAGGLGMVPGHVRVEASGTRFLGKGFLLTFDPSLDEIASASRVLRVVEFFWGEPRATLVAAGRSGGALVSWQVGSAAEARAAEAAGCDLVVAQGVEAGGHVRGTTPLDTLLAQVLDAVSIPVIAAGGIGNRARVAQLLGAGADAVRVGTRFLACPECDTHPDYVRALIGAEAGDAVLTEHFDAGGAWPAPVRVLRWSLDEAVRCGNRDPSPPTRAAESALRMTCYAGLSVADVRGVQPAAGVVGELTAGLG